MAHHTLGITIISLLFATSLYQASPEGKQAEGTTNKYNQDKGDTDQPRYCFVKCANASPEGKQAEGTTNKYNQDKGDTDQPRYVKCANGNLIQACCPSQCRPTCKDILPCFCQSVNQLTCPSACQPTSSTPEGLWDNCDSCECRKLCCQQTPTPVACLPIEVICCLEDTTAGTGMSSFCLRICCLEDTTCALDSTTATGMSSSASTTASSSDGTKSANGSSSTSDKTTEDSTLVVIVSCLVVVLVMVIAVVVGLFFWRRRQLPGGIKSYDSARFNLPAANPENGQDSLHTYDRLSRQNQTPHGGNIHSRPETTPDEDEDEYTDIDDNPITSVYNKLGEDRQQTMTTASNPKQTNSSAGAMVTSPSAEASPYTLAQVVDNDVSDKQPPEYFVLEQEGEVESVASTEPEQYFVLEDANEAGRQDSAPASQTQQPSLGERLQQDSAKQRLSSASFPDYFVLEGGGDDHQCAAAASDTTTFTDGADLFRQEGAEYSKLNQSVHQDSEYTPLHRSAP